MVGVKCISCGTESDLLFLSIGLWQNKIRVGQATIILCQKCRNNFENKRKKILENIFLKYIDEVKIEDS